MTKSSKTKDIDHDSYFRESFAEPSAAASLIRMVVTPEIVAALDLANLKSIPVAHFDPDVGKRTPDLLFQCPCTTGGSVVTILMEHKSGPSHLIALQILRYVLLLHEQYVKTPKKKRGPPELALPIVVYHGKERWTPHFALIRENKVPIALRAYILKVPALFFDFRSITDERILTFPGINPATQVALLALKNIFTENAESMVFLERLACRLGEIPSAQRTRLVTRTILYLWNRGDFSENSTKPLIDLIQDEEETMRFKTGRQKDHEADVQVGFEQGIERGVDIGLQRGIELRDFDVIEKMLAKGTGWDFITQITGLNRAGFEALQAKYSR